MPLYMSTLILVYPAVYLYSDSRLSAAERLENSRLPDHQVLVYEALSYSCMRPQAISV